MVEEFGMSSLGPVNLGGDMHTIDGRIFPEQVKVSEGMAARVDTEVTKLIDKGLETAKKILKENRKILDKVAEALIVKETLEGEEFEKIVGIPKPALATVTSH
jgi:cell division protease FtsH